jgi:YidC/Oxa1 family membrane protein insertase
LSNYQNLFSPLKQKKSIFKIFWKWFKIFLGVFLFVVFLFTIFQNFLSSSTKIGDASPVYDHSKKIRSGVFFEILLGWNGDERSYFFYWKDKKILLYPYYSIKTWSESWTKTNYNPFYGLFVFPIAFLLISLIKLFSWTNDLVENGIVNHDFAIFFAIFFTTFFIKLITLFFTFNSQKNQEKMKDVQTKVASIQKKYKNEKNYQMKRQLQSEIMQVYKREGVNPLSSFFSMFLTIPFLFSIFTVIKATRLLKESKIGGVKLIEEPWDMMKNQHNFIYLFIVVFYFIFQLFIIFLPLLLLNFQSKMKNPSSFNKKQLIIQLIFLVIILIVILRAPSGVGLYWIFSSFFQILQMIFFHFYNLKKKILKKQKQKNIVYTI